MYRKELILGAIFASLAAVPSVRAQLEGPDLASGKKAVHTVLIIPAQVNIVKSGMKGNETLVAESRSIEQALSPLVGSVLAQIGCQVLPDMFNEEALEKNPDVKYALADLQSRFDKMGEQMSRKLKDVSKGRFTMGDDVANFSPGATADALVFIRGQGVISTGGKKAFGLVTGVGGYSGVGIDIALVDAQSGALLYYALSGTGGDFVNQPDRMKKPIENSFKKFQNPKKKK